MDSVRNQLITCGSIFQGTCQTRSMTNVSRVTANLNSDSSQFLASSNVNIPTVAFISSGPNNNDVLYVGTVDLGPGAAENYDFIYIALMKYTCGVSSRRLTNDGSNLLLSPYQTMNAVTDPVGTFVTFTKDTASKRYGDVKYVAGFGLGGFSYFLSIQPASFPSPAAISSSSVSRIARVCQTDLTYDSFFDINIQCVDNTKNYNIIQSIIVMEPGTLLGTAIGVSPSDYVMLAVFYGAPDSALCIYKMADVRRSFTNNLQMCFNATAFTLGSQYYTVSSSGGTSNNNNLYNRQCGGGGTWVWILVSYFYCDKVQFELTPRLKFNFACYEMCSVWIVRALI